MNVAIVGEKGGGGKTTFATNLAGIRASRIGNGQVALLDTGPSGQLSVLERRACRSWQRAFPD